MKYIPQQITINVTKAVLISHRPGPDQVILTIEAPSPFPNVGYDAEFRLEIQKGKATEWCQEMGIHIDEEIKMR